MRAALLAMATGCVGAQPERAPGAPPDLVVLVVDGATPADLHPVDGVAWFTEAHAVSTDPTTAWRSLLTGQWPDTRNTAPPNTLPSVARLYGYETAARVQGAPLASAPDAAHLTGSFDQWSAGTCPGDAVAQARGAIPAAPATARLTVIHGRADQAECGEDGGVKAAVTALVDGATGWPGAVRVAVVGTTGPTPGRALGTADTQIPLGLIGPGWAPGRHPGLATPLDVLPTLLEAAGAVAPSDAGGGDLGPRIAQPHLRGPAVVFQTDGAGALAARTRTELLVVPAQGDPLPPTPPDDLQLTSDRSRSPDQAAADAAALYATLRAWDQSRRATTAAGRLGNDQLRDMLRDQGYWNP